MKKLVYGVSFIALIGMVLVGCQRDNLSPIKEMNPTKIDDFFESVSKMDVKVKEKNVIYINYVWDKTNNTIAVKDVKEAEPDFFLWDSKKNHPTDKTTQYTVHCENVAQSWSENCDGTSSCGNLIKDCLDQGVCTTNCTATMIYAPQFNSFFIGSEISYPDNP